MHYAEALSLIDIRISRGCLLNVTYVLLDHLYNTNTINYCLVYI